MIDVPTLVITGSQDLLTPLGDAEELAELIPRRAAAGAARRGARPDGRAAQLVQRRGAALPRRRRRRGPNPAPDRCVGRSAGRQLLRSTSPSTRRRRPAVTSVSRSSAPLSASPAFTAWSRATASAASTEPFAAARSRASARRSVSSGRPSRSRRLAVVGERVDHRQRVDALEQVLACGLAERHVGGGEVEDVVDDLEAHAEVMAVAGERVERRLVDRRRPCRQCDMRTRTGRRSCPRSRIRTPRHCGRRRRGAAARAPDRGTARRSSPRAGPRRRRRAMPRATTHAPSRKSPARIATMLLQRAFTDGTPRRVSASSMTSSWYSEPRCTSSTLTAPVTASDDAASPAPAAAYAAQRVSTGRIRFPPAVTRWDATSSRKRSGLRTASRRASSTRTRSADSGASSRVSAGRMARGYAGLHHFSKPGVP